jgi:AraC-like DNA-binding protein
VAGRIADPIGLLEKSVHPLLNPCRKSGRSFHAWSGLSKKQLIHRFREQIGVTPKLYARIIRLRRALTLLHEGSCHPADVAAAAGYYDQPHMNLDFRELAGLTPRDFVRATRFSPTTIAGESTSLFSKTGGQSTGYLEL